MYVNCHKDFLEGKKKFEAVLNRIGINTQLARLKQLTEEQRKMQIELKKILHKFIIYNLFGNIYYE